MGVDWREIRNVGSGQSLLGRTCRKKRAQELRPQERHFPLFAAAGVVFPPEGHAFPVKSEEPMVGNGRPVRVSAQVAEDLGGVTKGWFGINDPVLPMQPPYIW